MDAGSLDLAANANCYFVCPVSNVDPLDRNQFDQIRIRNDVLVWLFLYRFDADRSSGNVGVYRLEFTVA